MLPENVKWEAVFQSIVDTWLPLIGMVAAIVVIAIIVHVDELVEKQIEHELMQFKELATWSDYECERDKYMAVAEVAKKESFMAGFNYAVRLLERTHNP